MYVAQPETRNSFSQSGLSVQIHSCVKRFAINKEAGHLWGNLAKCCMWWTAADAVWTRQRGPRVWVVEEIYELIWLGARLDGEHMGITTKTEPPCCVMVLYTSVDPHFSGLPGTNSVFEMFKACAQQLLVLIDYYWNHYVSNVYMQKRKKKIFLLHRTTIRHRIQLETSCVHLFSLSW